jgi:hypothetical protein
MEALMISDLKEAFSIDNLHRAWRWLNSNPDSYYKGFFRHIYRAYAIAADENLKELHKHLLNEEFEPTHSIKIYLPKKSGIQRTYTLLTIEDQIVYQALVNVIADRLFPKVKARYNKENFGNLYAGSRSLFFYQDWHKGYKKFSSEIKHIYNKGFIYTASFDLTACYDSIDHNVLKHFLYDIGLQKEFNDTLCMYLMKWTATRGENRIYQGHGIPQGPLSSGLLSEVVLRHFDENKAENHKSWRYFRYVDDMRFFAKSEHNLRLMLVDMDLLSKQIGLFPQNSKISIHEVTDVEKEIKSISNPPEIINIKIAVDQIKIEKRLTELSPRLKVENDTRFKYVLSAASPSARLGKRLLQILKKNPHLYVSIFNYFDQFSILPNSIAEETINLLHDDSLYSAITAAGLRVLLKRCPDSIRPKLEGFSRSILSNPRNNASTELLTAATAILLKGNKLAFKDVNNAVIKNDEWWAKSVLVLEIDIDHFGEPSYEFILNELLQDKSVDVGVVVAELMAQKSLRLTTAIDRVNPTTQLSLKSVGIINARRGSISAISITMQHILGTSVKDIDWKKLLGKHHNSVAKKASMLKGYSETEATAWVNLLDTIHDNLLDSLFAHEAGALGTYSNIGGILGTPTCRFATKYPQTCKAFKLIHDKRYESALSHSRNYKTKKITQFIPFNFIGDSKRQLRLGYLELFRKW